jgi:hypothetical protein
VLSDLQLQVIKMQGSKTPYEIRLDIMKMAQEMLDREQINKQNTFFAKLETLRASNADANTITTFIDEHNPKMYESGDVVTRSSALYAFVNNSTTNKS